VSIASFRSSARVSRRSARRRPARLALSVWWRGAELDRLLAAGADPWSSAELTLRARRLTSARSRTRVANGLAGVMRSAGKRSPAFTAAVQPRSEDVLEAGPVIASLERRLRGRGPVAAQGVALVRLLLIDGNGALYRPSDPGALADCLRAAAAALSDARD
jgi:hypothetical protein